MLTRGSWRPEGLREPSPGCNPGKQRPPPSCRGLKGRRWHRLLHPFRVHRRGAGHPGPQGFTLGWAPAALQAAPGFP